MRAYRSGVAALALVAGITGSPVHAQLEGNPVYASPQGGVGLTLAGDFGKGANDASDKTTFVGARAILGLPFIRVGAGAGIYDPNDPNRDNEIALQGTLASQLVGGALLPVAVGIQVGAGYLKQSGSGVRGSDLTTLRVPIAVGVALNVPTPGLNIDPWVAPRIQIRRKSGGTLPEPETETDVGISAGLSLGLPMGLGLHVAADYLKQDGSDFSPLFVGIGVHYTISIPTLGVPLVPIV